ncbi:MAG: PEP-CTERM sorting domain-containing protein [Tepidisphaeraceae bacterium]
MVFSTPGTGLAVSADSSNPTSTPVRFGDLNAAYPADTQTFSAERLFTALGNNTVQVDFFVPGTNTPTSVLGFGAVFTDVELAGLTKFTVFYANGVNGGQFAVPTGPSGGLSFLGLTDPANRYSRIVIQSGTAVLGANEVLTNNQDLVFMDDFIYGEPLGVPEPTTLASLAAGTAITLRRRRA